MREPRDQGAQYRSKMQAAGTLRGTRAISLLLFLVPLIGYVYSIPLQFLPSIPGYIPVYIRHGDEPLEEINPELAEAFGETSSQAKNVQLGHTLEHASEKDDDINALLTESNSEHPYPLHVRQAESRSFTSVKDDEPRNENSNKPKLLTVYSLPDDNEKRSRRRYRGRNRLKPSKAPAFKVSPISDAEREELKNLAIEVEKEETKPNEFYFPNPRHSELSSEITRERHKSHHFAVPTKVQYPLDESSSNLSKISRAVDLSKPSDDHNVTISEAGKREHEAVKGQRPSTILSNVDKISPINLPDKSENNKNDKTKDSTEPNDEIAMD